MNDLQPDPVTVQAPSGALEWSPSRGFITEADDLYEARGEGELTLAVKHGVVAGVEGDAPLAVAVRVDRQITELRQALRFVSLRLQLVEDALPGGRAR